MVVAFHYDLYDAQGQKIETSKNGNPVLCLHGERGVLLALQDAFVGKVRGDDLSVTIPHQKAYGRRYPERQQRVSRKKIDGGRQQTFHPGQLITLRGEHGPSPATIIKAGKFNVDVDVNHPLAGVDLTFDVQIVSVRRASAEERAHGHAHGVGGHQH
ncbi:MAG: peptidylprolyl isomerase [Granulosicoccus sp.]|nr:peptidylprolyl isomerase [Granulosicoccus sp.]